MELRTTVVSTTVVSRPQPADVAGEDGEGYRSAERRKTDTNPHISFFISSILRQHF